MTAPTTGALDPARRPKDAEQSERTEAAELPGEARHFEQPEHVGAVQDEALDDSGAGSGDTDAAAADTAERTERHFERPEPTGAARNQARDDSGAAPGDTRTAAAERTEQTEPPGKDRHFEQPEPVGAARDDVRDNGDTAPRGTGKDAVGPTEQAELPRQAQHFEQPEAVGATPDQARDDSGAAPGDTHAAPADSATERTHTTVLHIASLGVSYGRRGRRGGGGDVLRGVDLEVGAGEIVGVIGETGSGKTTLARAVVGAAPVSGGRIGVGGVDVSALRGRELRAHRRSGRVQYMFQDPLRSLDPDLTVTELVGEPLAVAGTPRPERRARVAEALRRAGLDPEALGERIPGALSGGQRQRVALARAIVTRPALLLADEPVSALDASNRNHVLRLLDELRRDLGVAIVVISHDLSSLAGVADRIAVLYRGRLVEQGPTAEVLGRPLHPYTALLTASAPRIDRVRDNGESALPALPDLAAPPEPPAWSADPGACVFAHRCPFADDACRTGPDAAPYPGGRSAACHHALRPAGAPART
ncbi:ABC transporter ATP-binding protein [Actinacidiphila acididurans]|uniref:ABC transporter ATP-binding protein n=1 Tax=Actinacidiphila acididurans TaxID=2784346 RepID=A0ABS2TYF8_9ACTN|nr:ABC transporter ATP-binding protein [Actinacidiphila acididurans]MBM9508122.1 ABC transporter ATP-binding protein [Actinacidiphila acididurans]